MSRFLITASGKDRPGMVAGVTTALAEFGANLEDTSMTRLGGRFVMLLIVSAPGVDANDLQAALAGPATDLALHVAVEGVDTDSEEGDREFGLWSLTIYGADHPGIVAGIAQTLAGFGANVHDVSTRLIGSEDTASYTMLLEFGVPEDVNIPGLTDELQRVAAELDVSCHLQPVDADTF